MNDSPFTRAARVIAQGAADLLGTRVVALDERGNAVAEAGAGVPTKPAHRGSAAAAVRLPLSLDGVTGELVVDQPGDGPALTPRLAAGVVELLVRQVAVIERLPNAHELKNKFVLGLLRGEYADEPAVLREANVLGMDLTRPRAVILIDAADFMGSRWERLSAESPGAESWTRARMVITSVVSFFSLPSDAICAYIGNGEFAVLKASSTQDLEPWSGQEEVEDARPSWANLSALKRASRALHLRLQRDTASSVTIGLGRYHRGIPGLQRSYEDARAALAVGRRSSGPGRVYCLDELGMPALVGIADERTKSDLARHLLGPLDLEPELLETLETLFEEDCSTTNTAARLGVHRNTLGYRLEKIASLTGLDPRRFNDAVQIRLALVLRALGGHVAPLGDGTIDGAQQTAGLGHEPMRFARQGWHSEPA